MKIDKDKAQQHFIKPKKIVFPLNINQQHIKKIYAASNRSYAVFQDWVFSWGQITFQNGDQKHCLKQKKNKQQSFEVINVSIDQLALGSRHTFAYTKKIKLKSLQNQGTHLGVYCWGSNKNYELGLQQQRNYGFVKVQLFDQAFEAGFILSQISCGDSHTLAVFKDSQTGQSKLFGWGQSKSCQLALDTTGIVPYPVDIQYQFTSSIDKIYSKSDYNIAIANDGDLYFWGCNMFNRLGLDQSKKPKFSKNQDSNNSFQLNSPNTSRLSNLTSKQSPSSNTGFTDRIQNIGDNSISNVQKVKIPRKIQIFNKKIIQLALGKYHVIALTREGQCYSWGNGIYGQLGNNKFGQCSPQKITTNHLTTDIIFIDCSAGQQHSCILDKDGNVYTCGSNLYGILGHQKHENIKNKKRCKIFEKIDYFEQNKIKIAQIKSGDRHIIALSHKNELYGWGSNKYQQIEISNQKIIEQEIQKTEKKEQEQMKIEIEINKMQIIEKQKMNKQRKQIEYRDRQENKIDENYLKQKIERNKKQSKNIQNLVEDLRQNNMNEEKINNIKSWKQKYQKFLILKRKQEDQLLHQLDSILNNK